PMNRWSFLAAVAALSVVVSTLALAANVNIDALAGGYKKTFPHADIDGDRYHSENILEIVKVSPTAAYVRTHLEFFNGHICNIWGVAKVEGDGLVYHRETNSQGTPWLLSMKVQAGKVTLDDKDGACAIGTCGNRGMYNGTAFELKK